MARRTHSMVINGGRAEKGQDRHPFGPINSRPPSCRIVRRQDRPLAQASGNAKVRDSAVARRTGFTGTMLPHTLRLVSRSLCLVPLSASGNLRPGSGQPLAQSKSSGGGSPAGRRPGKLDWNGRISPFPRSRSKPPNREPHPPTIATSRRGRAPPVVDFCPFFSPRPFTMMKCVPSWAIHVRPSQRSR